MLVMEWESEARARRALIRELGTPDREWRRVAMWVLVEDRESDW